jgi:DNA-binding transcriptional LysR family regulator
MLDFELLRAFVAVADCGGFHRAAERLNLTQSTISQQIKRLEFETKRPLFRRTTRSVGLTNDGQMLLGDARRLLQLEGSRGLSPCGTATVWQGATRRRGGGCRRVDAFGVWSLRHSPSERQAQGADRRQRAGISIRDGLT